MRSAHCIALSLGAAASLAATMACLAADSPAYFMFEQKSPKGETEQFTFKLTDSARIAEARKILTDRTDMRRSVEGTIIQHKAAYNPRWSFYLDPPSIAFFEMAIEVCEANVTYMEAHLDEIGGSTLPKSFWCPWSSRLTAEVTDSIDPQTETPRKP